MGLFDVFVICILLFIIISVIVLFVKLEGEGSFVIPVILGIFFYALTLQTLGLNNGIFLAETVEKNEKEIGIGVYNTYRIEIDKFNQVIISKNKENQKNDFLNFEPEIRYVYSKELSNYFVKKYINESTNEKLTISFVGTTYLFDSNGKKILRVKIKN